MNDLFQLDDDEAYVFDAYVRPEYRGRGFAPLIRYRIYEELQRLNRTRIYSISFTFNASSRRFKRKLHAQEVELRMLVGIRRWRALDLRISVCGDRSRARRWKVLGPPARSRTNSG